MSKILRKKGLQIEAVLSMGNSLYSVLLGVMLAMLILTLSENTWYKYMSVADQDNLTLTILGIICLLLITIYYLIDWHDLNRIVYYDNCISFLQMIKWIVCIFALSIIAISIIMGYMCIASLVTAIYIPVTNYNRNKLVIQDMNEDVNKACDIAYNNGRRDACFNIILILLSVVSSSVAIIIWINSSAIVGNTLLIVLLNILWIIATYSKWIRSITFIENCYNTFLNKS